MRLTSRASLIVCAVAVGSFAFDLAPIASAVAQGARTSSPAGAREYFESLSQGERVTSPFLVLAGVHGMGVAPSATAVPDTGHHNLLIDTGQGALDAPLPATNNVVHLGNGETETSVTLSPGWHTLQLVFADGNEMNFDPPLASKPIRVFVRRR